MEDAASPALGAITAASTKTLVFGTESPRVSGVRRDHKTCE